MRDTDRQALQHESLTIGQSSDPVDEPASVLAVVDRLRRVEPVGRDVPGMALDTPCRVASSVFVDTQPLDHAREELTQSIAVQIGVSSGTQEGLVDNVFGFSRIGVARCRSE